MGISPAAIAGTSVGAIIGGAYAAGIKGRAFWNHLLRVLSNRCDVMSKLLRARVGRFIPRGAVETGCSWSDGHSRVVSSSLISDKLLIDGGL
jgi:predicted acylesterase/phospholipase RssA